MVEKCEIFSSVLSFSEAFGTKLPNYLFFSFFFFNVP